jgi:hypothetical protein
MDGDYGRILATAYSCPQGIMSLLLVPRKRSLGEWSRHCVTGATAVVRGAACPALCQVAGSVLLLLALAAGWHAQAPELSTA